MAEEVARALESRTQDVRDAARVARLGGQVGVKRAVELLPAQPKGHLTTLGLDNPPLCPTLRKG